MSLSNIPPQFEDLSIDEQAALIDAFREGKTIQMLITTDPVFIWNDIETPSWDDDCIYRVKPEKETEKITTKSTAWEFHSTHIQDLDLNEIVNEVNRHNPIALINTGDRFFVVIDNSLMNKFVCLQNHGLNEDLPDYDSEFKPYGYNLERPIYELKNIDGFNEWTVWCKAIKKMPWPKTNDYKKRKITVVLPKV